MALSRTCTPWRLALYLALTASVSFGVAGRSDAADAPADALARLMEANPSPGGVVSLDLSDVVFIDSTGVAMLQQAGTQLDALGCQLVLTNPSRAVRRVLTILGLLEYFSVDN